MDAPRMHAGLILIHGAGKEPSGFSRGFVASMTRHLGVEPVALPAWWGDLCNFGPEVKGVAASPAEGSVPEASLAEASVPAASPVTPPLTEPAQPLSKEAQAFRRDYLRDLGVGVKGVAAGRTVAQPTVRSVGGTLVSLADTANDAVQYLFNPRLRAAAQSRLVEKLEEARRRFDRSILVSHSLGTVIAYDVLRQSASSYNIQSWYTTGSPLARLARLGRVNTNVGQIGGGALATWHNLFDTSDIVASALSGAFAFAINDVKVDNGGGILNSHNYWGNVAVAAMVAEDLKRRYLRVPARAEDAPAARPRRPRAGKR